MSSGITKPRYPKPQLGTVPRGHVELYHVPRGPDDVVENDVDPHELATCHRGSGRQLCCGPVGKSESEFWKSGFGEQSESESLVGRILET
jgi:hypothetical protein